MQTTTMCCENPRGKSFWMELAYDQTLWNKTIFDQAPSVVAHEYKRLQDELAHNQPFAAMLQLKDVMEALLKFEVLLAYSWAGQSGINHFREKVECIITTRSLSMGAWMELAKRIISFFKPGKTGVFMPDILYRPLSLVRKFYDKHEFVNWRNEAIGHGALAFAEDEDFRKDIREKLLLVEQLFEEIESYLKEQNIQTDGGELILMGSENASDLPLREGKVFFTSKAQNLYYELSPYMYIRKGSVYFFDNQKKPKRTQRLCYTTGGRRNEEEEYFSKLDTIREEQGLKMDLEAASRFIVASEEKFLNQLGMESNFVEPKHLISWLQKEVNKAEKGIYLLKMPRGTGKSTFAEKLNRLYDKPLEVADDIDVRTYHLSRTQVRSKSDFERGIETQWALAHQQDPWTAYKRMVDYRNEGCEPAEAFAEYLRQVLDFTDRRRGRERILMVCDGLDEIAESAVWEYIPRAEQLPDGVYILLTSRDPELEKGLPEALSERLNGLDIQGGMTVRADSPENIGFLKKYATQDGSIQENQIERLLELAQNRVLYLGMYLTLLRSGLELNELPEAQKLCGSFMAEIEKKYGEKKAQRLCRILCVLSGVGRFEALTLKEIAELSDEVGVTFELLGMMNDLRSIMKVNRGYAVGGRQYAGENRYSMVNVDIAAAMFELLPEAKQQAQDSVLDMLKEIEDMPEEEKITDGMLLTLGYATELLTLANISESNYPQITKDLALTIHSKLVMKSELQLLVLNRLKKAYSQVLYLYRDNDKEGVRAVLYLQVGSIFGAMLEVSSELEMYKKAQNVFEELDAAGYLLDQCSLAQVYSKVASALEKQQRIPEALEMYEKAQKAVEELDASGRLLRKENLAKAYVDMAGILIARQKLSEAIETLGKARVILEKMDVSGALLNRCDLAAVYFRIARVFMLQDELNDALEWYEKARKTFEKLDTTEQPLYRNYLAAVYIAMADVLVPKEKLPDALELYEKARIIREELDAAGQLLDRSDLAEVYRGLGHILKKQKRLSGALELYETARMILEEYDKLGQLLYRNDLATIYNDIGDVFIYEEYEDLDKALEMYMMAKGIQEELNELERLLYPNDLARTYFNIGYVLQTMKRLQEASLMYEMAQAIQKQLKENDRLLNVNDLSWTYLAQGSIAIDNNEYLEATYRAKKAIEIKEGNEIDINLSEVVELMKPDTCAPGTEDKSGILIEFLAGLKMKEAIERLDTAEEYWNNGKFDESLNLYMKAISAMEDLVNSGQEDFRNGLAVIQFSTSQKLFKLKKYREALVMLNQSKTTMEELNAKDQLDDREILAGLYVFIATVAEEYWNNGKFDKSLNLYMKAISAMEDLVNSGQEDFRNKLAVMQFSTSQKLFKQKKYREALVMLNQSKTIMEELNAKDQLDDREILARLYVFIAAVLERVGNYEGALCMNNKALQYIGHLQKIGQLKQTDLLIIVHERKKRIENRQNASDTKKVGIYKRAIIWIKKVFGK